MAIDSKEKRAGVIGVGRPYMRDKFPVATPDEQWRMSSGLTYGGNALSPPTGVNIPTLVRAVANVVISGGSSLR